MPIRCFVAVDIEPAVHEAVLGVQQELAGHGADIRWARPEGLHCTLKFLGSVRSDLVDDVGEAIGLAAHDFTPFNVTVAGVGAFPGFRRPRVLWVGIDGKPLVDLAEAVQQSLAPLDFAIEDRPFRPHITLGRVRSLEGWPELRPICTEHRQTDFGSSRVDMIRLYRSETRPGGSVYKVLGEFPLRGDAAVTLV